MNVGRELRYARTKVPRDPVSMSLGRISSMLQSARVAGHSCVLCLPRGKRTQNRQHPFPMGSSDPTFYSTAVLVVVVGRVGSEFIVPQVHSECRRRQLFVTKPVVNRSVKHSLTSCYVVRSDLSFADYPGSNLVDPSRTRGFLVPSIHGTFGS